MTLEEAFNFSSLHQYLGRHNWIKQGRILHLIPCDQSLDQIKLSLDSAHESLNADDWDIYEIRE